MSAAEMKDERRAARVLIVDDHPIIREGLTLLINQEPGMDICGGAESGSCRRYHLEHVMDNRELSSAVQSGQPPGFRTDRTAH